MRGGWGGTDAWEMDRVLPFLRGEGVRGWRESNVGHCTDPQLDRQRECGRRLPHACPPCCHIHSHRGDMCVPLKYELPCSPREQGCSSGRNGLACMELKGIYIY